MSDDFRLLVGYTGNQNVTPTDIFVWFLATYLFWLTWVRWLRKSMLPSSILLLRWRWAFHYDVILQMRSFVSFNNSKFITDKNSFKALQVYCKVYSKNSWLILRCLHYGTWHLTTPSYRKLNFYLVRCWILVILQFTVTLSN